MPTYDYQCSACGHEFELFQQMSDAVKRKCPECKKLKLVRLVGTGGAVIFKGSGFYETDYRSKSYQKGVEAEKKARESSSDKGDSSKKKDADKTKKTNSSSQSTKKAD